MKIVAAALLACIALSANAQQQLVPLLQWEKSAPKWKDDLSEIAYVTIRCSTILNLVGNFFIENAANEQHKRDGKKLLNNAEVYTEVGTTISFNTGMSEEAILNRAKAFYQIYTPKLVENKKIHNNIFMGDTKDDFDFCVKNYAFANTLNTSIKGKK